MSRVRRGDRVMSAREVNVPEILVEQARSLPPLSEAETDALLVEVRARGKGAALDRLVEQQLGTILELAAARRGRGVEVGDLAQEAAIASVVAITEYAGRGGTAPGLHQFVVRLVGSHMDETIELAALERASDEAFIRDAETYEITEVRMRHELGRDATAVELAAELGWPEERIAIVAEMLADARARYDSEIVDYLDDIDEE
jgi:DNA-directed RNA polymerase sigma subunit (sigma70/sigma32)